MDFSDAVITTTEELMDLERILTQQMTPDQWAQFKATRNYLLAKCNAYIRYPEKCANERRLLAGMMRKELQEIWDHALHRATASDTHEGSPSEREERIRYVAEQIMIDNGFPPPHWTHVVDCSRCGSVIVSDAYKNLTRVPNCRWCSSAFAEVIQLVQTASITGDSL